MAGCVICGDCKYCYALSDGSHVCMAHPPVEDTLTDPRTSGKFRMWVHPVVHPDDIPCGEAVKA